MSLDGEMDRVHQSLSRIEDKLDAIHTNQSNFVTHTESNIKTGILAGLSLLLTGKISWADLLHFIKP